jgi:hypothetical protein
MGSDEPGPKKVKAMSIRSKLAGSLAALGMVLPELPPK